MTFWIFMLLMNLLFPLTMIVLGSRFVKKAPATISAWYGYRTRMSMKNRDTWEFAHRYFGRLYRVTGWVLLPLAIGAMLFLLKRDVGSVSLWAVAILWVQLLANIGLIIPTEIALKKQFDQDGIHR